MRGIRQGDPLSSAREKLFEALLELERAAEVSLPTISEQRKRQITDSGAASWLPWPGQYTRTELAKAVIKKAEFQAAKGENIDWLPSGASASAGLPAVQRSISDALSRNPGNRHVPKVFERVWVWVTIWENWADQPQERSEWARLWTEAGREEGHDGRTDRRPTRGDSTIKGDAPAGAGEADQLGEGEAGGGGTEHLADMPLSPEVTVPRPGNTRRLQSDEPPIPRDTGELRGLPRRRLYVGFAGVLTGVVAVLLLVNLLSGEGENSASKSSADPSPSAGVSSIIPTLSTSGSAPVSVNSATDLLECEDPTAAGAPLQAPDARGIAFSVPDAKIEGSDVTITWTVKTTKPVTFANLQLAFTNPRQQAVCFIQGDTINGSKSFRVTQALSAGSHTVEVVYKISGATGWHGGPDSTFVVP